MGTNILLSGAVLSSLLYENHNNNCNGEGFLIGDVDKVTTQDITDTQMCLENTHFMASISGYLPSASLQKFYTGSGQLKESDLKQFLGDNYSKVIGWYRCRGTCSNIFWRENIIHKQLSELMNPANEHFIFALFSSPSNCGNGTIQTMYKFYTMSNRELVPTSYKIANMGETSSATYYKDSPNTHLYASDALERSLKCIDDLEPGVKSVQDLYAGLLAHLNKLLPEYSKVCKKQSDCVEELMRLKSQCYVSNLLQNCEPTSLEESNINELDGLALTEDAVLKNRKSEINGDFFDINTESSKLENKKAVDTNDKKKKFMKSTNNNVSKDVNIAAQKNKPKAKLKNIPNKYESSSLTKNLPSKSPSSIRPTKESVKKSKEDCNTPDKSSVKNSQSLESPYKLRINKTPQINSPLKGRRTSQMSRSPEF